MLSRLSVGSATCASQVRRRICLEVSPTLDPPTASADSTPTWSEAPSWHAVDDLLPIRLEPELILDLISIIVPSRVSQYNGNHNLEFLNVGESCLMKCFY